MADQKSINLAPILCLLIIILTAKPTTCGSPDPTTHPNDAKEDFLQLHNDIRMDKGVRTFLTWNDTLVSVALARGCSAGSGGVAAARPYGENAAESIGRVMTASEAIVEWATGMEWYDYDSNTCDARKDCRPYLQIVWRDTVRLGCAKIDCPLGRKLVVCEYDPPGNKPGERPY